MYTSTTPDPDLSLPTLHTVNQAGRILGLSPYTVYRLIQTNELPAVRIGCNIRISSDQLFDVMTRGTRPVRARQHRPRTPQPD